MQSILNPTGFLIFLCAGPGKRVVSAFAYGHKFVLPRLLGRETERRRRLLAILPVRALAFPHYLTLKRLVFVT